MPYGDGSDVICRRIPEERRSAGKGITIVGLVLCFMLRRSWLRKRGTDWGPRFRQRTERLLRSDRQVKRHNQTAKPQPLALAAQKAKAESASLSVVSQPPQLLAADLIDIHYGFSVLPGRIRSSRLAHRTTTDLGPALYVRPGTGGAVCHSTMSWGGSKEVSIHRRQGRSSPLSAAGSSNSSGSQ